MRAVVFEENGGPEVLKVAEIPDPTPGPGEVRVGIMACALNRLDLWVRQGIPGVPVPMPHILGSDICGEIEEVGKDVSDRKTGQFVVLAPGGGCRVCRT